MKNKQALQLGLWLGWPLALMGAIFLVWSLTGNEYRAGARLYEIHCGNCHMEAGQGLGALIPPLAGADYVQNHGADMACLIVNGIAVPMEVNGQIYTQPMPGNATLTPRDIAAILNFIRNAWGNETEQVLRPQDVQAALESCGAR